MHRTSVNLGCLYDLSSREVVLEIRGTLICLSGVDQNCCRCPPYNTWLHVAGNAAADGIGQTERHCLRREGHPEKHSGPGLWGST